MGTPRLTQRKEYRELVQAITEAAQWLAEAGAAWRAAPSMVTHWHVAGPLWLAYDAARSRVRTGQQALRFLLAYGPGERGSKLSLGHRYMEVHRHRMPTLKVMSCLGCEMRRAACLLDAKGLSVREWGGREHVDGPAIALLVQHQWNADKAIEANAELVAELYSERSEPWIERRTRMLEMYRDVAKHPRAIIPERRTQSVRCVDLEAPCSNAACCPRSSAQLAAEGAL